MVYLKTIQQFLQFIEWKPLSALGTVDIEEYQRSLSGLAKRTIGMRIAAVCSLVSYIHKRNPEVMPRNIGAAVQRVKVPSELAARALSEDDVHAIIAAERKPWKVAMLRVFYGTGIRPEELVKIQRKHITERPEGCGRIIIHGKGDKVRVLNVFNGTWAAVLSILPSDPNGFLFPAKRGRMMHPTYASFLVSEAGKKAGFEHVSAVWLRHAHASHALDRHAPIHTVRDTLGHTSIASTGKYLHANPQDSSGRYLNEG